MKRLFTLSESIRNFFRRQPFPRSGQQRGTIMVLTSVAMIGLLGMMALAIDLGYLFSAQTQIQNGINAAALAAGAGLRVTIEPDPKAPEQENIARSFARKYGSLNEPRLLKFANPKPEKDDRDKDDVQSILANMEVIVDTTTDIPSVRVNASVPTPTLFAGVIGLSRVRIGAAATATLFPVEGGTGTIASGAGPGGCWRPLFFPDTFYDAGNTVMRVDEPGLFTRRPTEAGDYYRSRFAGGARAANPFFVDPPGGGPFVTGLRDTKLESDVVERKTIMGQQFVTFRPQYYKIANFSGLRRDQSLFPLSSLSDVIKFGYCGQIRVGDRIPVYLANDPSAYDQLKRELTRMRQDFGDFIEPDPERLFRYVQSAGYRVPNTHPLILPVLLYNPMIWRIEADGEAATELVVTNFGLFFLKEVTLQGDLVGYFVREIIAGGIPIAPGNMSGDSNSPEFKRRYLPMSVQLIPNQPKKVDK
jgi:Flp pilus assembly protein TadG